MKKYFKTKDLTQMSLLVAILSVSAYITIPLSFTPAGLTLQTMIINLIAFILSPIQAFITVLVYILLGLVGLPVFSGGRGGPGVLFGPTGGYILAFLIAAPCISWMKNCILQFINKAKKENEPDLALKKRKQTTASKTIVLFSLSAILVGMPIIYLLGSIYMSLALSMSFMKTLTLAVFPFIPLDLVKCFVAALLAVPIRNAIEKM